MIFISIASYCDDRLRYTMADALVKAKYKSDINFGIVEQAPLIKRINLRSNKARYVGIDPFESRGACWARSICMSLYQGEEFFLQIDSHMLFDQDWDEKLINTLQACPSPKPIISSYPNAFEIIDGKPVRKPAAHRAICHIVKGDFPEDSLVLSFEGRPVDSDLVPGFTVGAGCIFTHGQFIQEVPYDPWLYFHGEEQALAARAYTFGWDIFHTPLPIYHLYDTDPDNCYRPKHWSEQDDKLRKQRWWELDKAAKERISKLFSGQSLGIYGLGPVRTLKQYEDFSGIDYTNRVIHERAKADRTQ